MELGFIVDKFFEGCFVCYFFVFLNIINMVYEICYGLGSLLIIRCVFCDGKIVVLIGKRYSGFNEC